MKLRLKPGARADLLAIRAYSEDRWGRAKAADFLEGLIEALGLIPGNPQIGRSREMLFPGLRSLRYRAYVIFYLVEAEGPVILAVLHERRNHAALNFADRMEGE